MGVGVKEDKSGRSEKKSTLPEDREELFRPM